MPVASYKKFVNWIFKVKGVGAIFIKTVLFKTLSIDLDPAKQI
jgi:hypothetical protein